MDANVKLALIILSIVFVGALLFYIAVTYYESSIDAYVKREKSFPDWYRRLTTAQRARHQERMDAATRYVHG
jgi:hypothetical protein